MEKKKKLKGLETESRVIQSGDFYFLAVTAWEDEKEYVKEMPDDYNIGNQISYAKLLAY